MNGEKIQCPKCGNTNGQIIHDIDLEGGHRADWAAHKEWDFARALLFLVCASCGHKHEIKIEWRA